jgi:Ferredoxin-thioredoxin reductase, catalytic subunit
MNVRQLFDMLKRIQEPKGYFFNPDTTMTMPLLEGLLTNKERLGYMACPCRLANGAFDDDKDIVCPCEYREADVKEFGTCFCGLYGSKAWVEGKVEKVVVPERRPVEKILW